MPPVNPFNIYNKFRKEFESLGNLGEEYYIQLKPGTKPFTLFTPRRVPLPLRMKVSEKLYRMETMHGSDLISGFWHATITSFSSINHLHHTIWQILLQQASLQHLHCTWTLLQAQELSSWIVLTRHLSKSKMKWLWFSRSPGHLLRARKSLRVPLEWMKSYTCVVSWVYYVQQLLKITQRPVVHSPYLLHVCVVSLFLGYALSCLGGWCLHCSEYKGV